MSVSGIGSVTNSNMQGAASSGDSAATEAKESTTTKLSEQSNGGKAGSTAGSSQSSSNANLTKIKTYANQHKSAAEIAQLLGISVSTVMQEASAAGVNLNSGSSSRPPAQHEPGCWQKCRYDGLGCCVMDTCPVVVIAFPFPGPDNYQETERAWTITRICGKMNPRGSLCPLLLIDSICSRLTPHAPLPANPSHIPVYFFSRTVRVRQARGNGIYCS